MNTSYIYINIVASLCFAMMFIAFSAAERSREIRAWIFLLLDMMVWSAGSLFMRLDLYPNYQLWYYVSLLALFSIAYLVYNYVYLVANENKPVLRRIWFFGTLIVLAISATGVFLAPPDKIVNDQGRNVFVYSSDFKIAIPLVFFMAIIVSIVMMIRKILRERGNKAPGVNELIIGCIILGMGNIIQILPGNVFPWDTLCGLLFVLMLTTSLHKRRMFDTSMLISSTILVIEASVMCVVAAALFFPRVIEFCEMNGHGHVNPYTTAFMILAGIIFVAIYGFRKMLHAVFNDQEKQSDRIKKYSYLVSRTLNVDDILRETVRVIKSEINVSQMYICLLDNGKFVPMRSAMPLKPANFTIGEDNPCVKYLQRNGNHLVLEEFEANPLYKSIWKNEREIFSDNEIVSICALKDNDQISGLLLLTEKEKGVAYTYADFAFLNTVCSVASMALKNASLYEHVAEREHLFSGMTAFIPNVILIKKKGDPSFCFISANTEKVLGLPYEFFNKHSPHDALAACIGEAKAKEVILDFTKSPEAGYGVDMPFVRPDDNTEHTIRCAFSAIVSNGIISHYVYVLSDISEDIAAKELLRSSVEIAQNSSKAKGEFLSHMSHEIRTPMNSIAGLTYLAREQLDKDDDSELAGYLEQIDQSAHYLLNLLNNIMDMSKIENQLYEMRKEPFAVNSVIDDVCAVYSSQMQAKGINFKCTTDNFKNNNLIGDEIALQKILNNLLSNAYKFTPSGGKVGLFATQRYIGNKTIVMHFEVSDTGVGISKEFVKKIYEPYTQELSTNGNSSGSGLGMAICKNMVDMQGGTITAVSNIGAGTKFVVDIPYSVNHEGTKHDEKTELDYSILRGKRIMVVDDVAINTMITRKLLEKHGIIVDSAENGEKALELFERSGDYYYDCILMDVQMPVMNGFEAAEAIRANKMRYSSVVPIIAMTADAFISDSGTASRNKFDGYIIKPVSPDVLYATLVQLFVERE